MPGTWDIKQTIPFTHRCGLHSEAIFSFVVVVGVAHRIVVGRGCEAIFALKERELLNRIIYRPLAFNVVYGVVGEAGVRAVDV